MTNLIPYKGNLYQPQDAIEVTQAIAIPGSFERYSGHIAVAITTNALWLVAPSREEIMVPFPNIRRVRAQNFPGIAYHDYVDGVETLVAPNDTAGVTVEFQTVGNFIHEVSFLTHFSNKAHEWARKIQQAVDGYNRRLYAQ
jgi:hypothetical protein